MKHDWNRQRRTVIVKMIVKHNWDEAPHRVEGSPAGVACHPRDARVKVDTTVSPTDDQPPPRQEGEAVAMPCLRQIRDEAGAGGREQLHTREAVAAKAADHHLPLVYWWCVC